MTVHGCSGDHGNAVIFMRWDIPADDGMFVRFYAGCSECGSNYCRGCFTKQGGKCAEGHGLVVDPSLQEDEVFRSVATRYYHRSGIIEVEPGAEVSRGLSGAWVQAWVYIPESVLSQAEHDRLPRKKL